MAKQLFANNAGSMLAVGIDDNDLTLQVGGGHGALFPLPSGGDFFLVTLTDAAGNIEIVKCTARASDVLTIVRAQEGTSAQSWTGAACRVELRNTEGTMDRFVQTDGDYTILGDLILSGEVALSGGVSGAVDFTDAGNLVISEDSKELRFGAGGDDLAIFHDGTNNYIVSRTGALYLTANEGVSSIEVQDGGNPALIFNGLAPNIVFNEEDAGAEETRWRIIGNGGNFAIGTLTDAGASGASAIVISRTGTVVDTIQLLGETRIDALSVSGVVYSGTYTPTYTGLLNVTDIDGEGVAMYTRVGDIVTVKGMVIIDPTVINTNTQFRVSLPIASNLVNPEDLLGLLDATYSSVGRASGSVVGSTSADAATANFTSGNTSDHTVTFEFSYLVN